MELYDNGGTTEDDLLFDFMDKALSYLYEDKRDIDGLS